MKTHFHLAPVHCFHLELFAQVKFAGPSREFRRRCHLNEFLWAVQKWQQNTFQWLPFTSNSRIGFANRAALRVRSPTPTLKANFDVGFVNGNDDYLFHVVVEIVRVLQLPFADESLSHVAWWVPGAARLNVEQCWCWMMGFNCEVMEEGRDLLVGRENGNWMMDWDWLLWGGYEINGLYMHELSSFRENVF